MNPTLVISAVIAVVSFHYAEATFDIVTGSGALFTGGGGPHLLLASGTAGTIGPIAAVIGAGILLKSLALLAISAGSRGKRSIDDGTDVVFSTISASEPASCVRQLICDLAAREQPSEYDVILSLFNTDTPATSPKFDFAVAATLGKESKSAQACELRYSCPLSVSEIQELFN